MSISKGPVRVSTLLTFITSPLSFYGAQGMKTRCAVCGQRFGEGSAAAGGRKGCRTRLGFVQNGPVLLRNAPSPTPAFLSVFSLSPPPSLRSLFRSFPISFPSPPMKFRYCRCTYCMCCGSLEGHKRVISIQYCYAPQDPRFASLGTLLPP